MLALILFALVAVSLVVAFGPWFKGWRTQTFGALTSAWAGGLPFLAELSAYLKDLDWTQYVSAKAVPGVILALTVIFMWLRYRTTGPVGVSK
jgi:hypothetical protein